MFRLWPRHAAAEITAEKGDQVASAATLDASGDDEVARIAARVVASGMAAPVSILLRMLRPLHWLGGQALYVAQPFLEALTNPRATAVREASLQVDGKTRRVLGIAGVARLLEEEEDVDRLLARLEKADRKGGSGEPG